MPRSLAIFGMTGSTARVNSVEAKTTRLTILRTGGIANFFRHPELRAKRASKDAAEAPTEIGSSDFGIFLSVQVGNSRLGCDHPSRAASRPPQGDDQSFELATLSQC